MTVQEEVLVVSVPEVRLGDVLLDTHVVVGIGKANQRGRDALRFDLELTDEYQSHLTPSARLVIPIDHQISVARAVSYYGD